MIKEKVLIGALLNRTYTGEFLEISNSWTTYLSLQKSIFPVGRLGAFMVYAIAEREKFGVGVHKLTVTISHSYNFHSYWREKVKRMECTLLRSQCISQLKKIL